MALRLQRLKSFWGNNSALTGAAFLMATSAIGPGFITQTTVFTFQLGASFAFAIGISILLDLIVQWNVWLAVAIGGKRASVLANEVIPQSGTILTLLVVIGGMVFNIGNVAGAGLGLEILTGMSVRQGAIVSGAVAVIVFLFREFGRAMDRLTGLLGFVMIGMMLLVVFYTHPPVGIAIRGLVWPEEINSLVVLTLVGGTVGGYITFAGAHRMLDARQRAHISLQQVKRSAGTGILLSGVMRVFLFLAVFGVIATGFLPDNTNPAASVFRQALGDAGYRIFGIILWCAAITSIVGASYTSVSFLEGVHPFIPKYRRWVIVLMIIVAVAFFAWYGQPVQVLVFAGAANGLILPISLGLMLWVLKKHAQNSQYHHPRWLTFTGWFVVVAMTGMAIRSLGELLFK